MVPAHITGFFTIYKDRDPMKTGSKGAGITLDRGVKLEIEEGKGVYYNNERVNIDPINYILKNYKINYKINFISDFPLGSGLGMSGACSLSLSKLIFKDFNAVKLAHKAEVLSGTGLGDVIAQYVRGFVIRKSPGFPINVVKVIDKDYYVIVEILGKKETKDVINNREFINKINYFGERCLKLLLENPNIKNFVKLSYDFALNIGLMDDEIKELCEDLKFTVGASQSMIGKTLFCIAKKEHLKDAISILKNPIVCHIK
ncbi:GHMP kinase [Methanocaldococcus villosus KIN24-T80]|uniref:Pantoate kinase n=1 Tax=Methanocaldococcus villosus KIN24-T80 TaxID=1069083 RepID=N6VSH1_9EURY|nr:pantoate kinase [Methanocaldococcus villosus]ENN96101.1 GHMP kinase [Methanocaldococcus villosus KIN24-T80]